VGDGLMATNTNTASGQYGQQYRVVSAPGGVYHVYPNGQRVFVPKPAATGGLAHPIASGGAVPPPAPAPGAPQGGADPAPAAPFTGDASYWADQALRNFQRKQQVDQLTQQSAYDKTDFQEALRRRVAQHPKDIQSTQEGANRQGLFYSGQMGKRLGDLETQYTRENSDAQQAYDRREAARSAARTAIEQGAPLEEAAALAAAADRATTSASSAADAGMLVPNQPPAPAPAAPPKPVPVQHTATRTSHVRVASRAKRPTRKRR
jgi:hypothetical protein